jgi:nucleoside-diphosphate-sugar epimerase
MRVAVTGASGFIGRHLMEALRTRGDAVPVPRPFERGPLGARLAGVDVLVHLAGVVSAVREREFFDANVDGTRRVAEAARDAGVRLVHVSSLAAAGPAAPSAPRDEDDPCTPITPYGRSKLEGESAVASTEGLRWTILRPGVVYGPGDRALHPLFYMAEGGAMIVAGRPSAAYTFIHIDDVVRALLAAIDRDLRGETIFLGHRDPVSPRALMAAIRDRCGGRALMIPVPLALMRVAAAAGDLAGLLRGRPSPINRWRYRELASKGFVCRVDRMRDRLGVEARIGLRDGLATIARRA